VKVEIRPEPDERDAVLAAIEALLSADGAPAAYRSQWRVSGDVVRPREGSRASRVA
jgi:hypothetical protein